MMEVSSLEVVEISDLTCMDSLCIDKRVFSVCWGRFTLLKTWFDDLVSPFVTSEMDDDEPIFLSCSTISRMSLHWMWTVF